MSEGLSFQAPRQDRSRRTLSRIVQAARDLVAERGADATSVQEIVRRADSSVGSFYARFGGKDDLFDYIERHVWEEARDRWERALEERAWESLPLRELAAGVVRILLDVGRHEAKVRRALQLRRSAKDGETPSESFQANVRQGLRRLIMSHAPELKAANPERAVDLGLRVVVGGLRELETAGDVPDEEIVAEVSRLLLAYLGAAPQARPEPSTRAERPERVEEPEKTSPPSRRIDFFNVWG